MRHSARANSGFTQRVPGGRGRSQLASLVLFFLCVPTLDLVINNRWAAKGENGGANWRGGGGGGAATLKPRNRGPTALDYGDVGQAISKLVILL